MTDYPSRLKAMADFSPESDTITKIIPQGAEFLREASPYVAELETALLHAVEIAEAKVTGTWDDLLPYRKLLDQK